ncbi:MAG: hemerythrin domain-containing protein [Armatimonadota bacterium]
MTTQLRVHAESYLDRNIKDLLTEHPALGDVLNDYNIGCVTCSVGTCQLKDIVKFHYLPENQLRELMYRIAKTVDPEADIELPRHEEAPESAAPREIRYSPPMKSLVQEHELIKRWLALIPDVIAVTDLEKEADRQLILKGIDFIRSYADKFHHAKEEDILFKRFDENQEIIRVMLEDHTTGRNHVKAMLVAVETRDNGLLAEHLLGYRELLSGHIKKEDEILYPWMDRELSTTQIGELFRDFNQADNSFDPGMAGHFAQFIERIEQSMRGAGE